MKEKDESGEGFSQACDKLQMHAKAWTKLGCCFEAYIRLPYYGYIVNKRVSLL